MSRVKLTKRAIESVKPAERDVILWDTDLKGFGCKITPTDRRIFFVKYRVGGGRGATVRKPTIGEFGTLKVDEARDIAWDWLSQVRKGGDPGGDRQTQRKAPTVSELCDRYLEEHVETHNKASTAREFRRLVERQIRPSIGRMKVADVQRKDIQKLHHALRETPYQGNRVLAVMRKMFNLAEAWGFRRDGTNPCRHVETYRETARDRFLDADELTRLGRALDTAERDGSLPASAAAAMRFLALTGCRVSEATKLRWEYVDLDAGIARLPDAKAGPRTVALGDAAVVLLEPLGPREEGWVFLGLTKGNPLSLFTMDKLWRPIREAAKLGEARLHDLRHTVGTYAGQAGVSAFLVRDLLGHRTMAMTGRYVSRDAHPLRLLASDVSGTIAAHMNCTGENVVALRARSSGSAPERDNSQNMDVNCRPCCPKRPKVN